MNLHVHSPARRFLVLVAGFILATTVRAAHPLDSGRLAALLEPSSVVAAEAGNAASTSTLTVHLVNRQGARIEGDVKLVLNGVVVQGWTRCPKATGVTFTVTPGTRYKVVGRPRRSDLYRNNSRQVTAPFAGLNKVTSVTLPRR